MKEVTFWQTGISLLVLRLFAAYEFFEAGLEKWRGDNWFAEIAEKFPPPFLWLSPEINWQLAMFAELILPLLLLIGLATRFAAAGLMVLTLVAWAAVHAGLGYNVGEGGYKMALIYLVVLLPLLFQGAGRFSLDALIDRR
ncbi:DoxX family membrane protein [Neisseria brasiliensis]|uniref:HvfX family Cu-binding RiPP maturation protein n=1 Tax=Neisseria TaxID=482 RepID=UPI000C27CF3C|nr:MULTISPECIES: DoxX family protein [Neisseria]PJO78032.1 hypothetical protein CWC45_07265 [Neisseria sp. N177_16]QGL24989.1 DoxX family membrane protein [Neisseria brasiliensis]